MTTGSPIQLAHLAHRQCHIISDHRFIGIIGNEDPRFILMFSQKGNFLIELQTIRFLRLCPSRVSTTFNLQISLHLISRRACDNILHQRHVGVNILRFANNVLSTFGINPHNRQTSESMYINHIINCLVLTFNRQINRT